MTFGRAAGTDPSTATESITTGPVSGLSNLGQPPSRGSSIQGSSPLLPVPASNAGSSITGSSQAGARKHQAVVDWVWRYYSQELPGSADAATASSSSGQASGTAPSTARLRSSNVIVTSRPPLYFQHEGHSRTIIGIERRQVAGKPPDYSLLLLDPGIPAHVMDQALR
eukprot:jgi/Chrzof1/4625/Cz14g20130.t1